MAREVVKHTHTKHAVLEKREPRSIGVKKWPLEISFNWCIELFWQNIRLSTKDSGGSRKKSIAIQRSWLFGLGVTEWFGVSAAQKDSEGPNWVEGRWS